MSAGARLVLRGVEKRFGETRVLSGIDLEVAPGGFLAIVGKSGCGKSTLLRLMVGLETPTAGVLEAEHAGARLVFQEPRLLPWLTVRRNVEVGLGPNAAGADAAAAAQRALSEVGLGERGDVWPSVLSGGQRQRVALARALVSRPRFLALDEPLGALDALTRIEMQEMLEGVWRAQGFTAAIVTHDVSEAVVLGDRVVLVQDGGIALDVAVDVPRPRRHGDPRLAEIERRILDTLFGRDGEARAAHAAAG